MFFKSTVEYFQGKTFNADLPEDLEARRTLLEKEKADEEAKTAFSMMYQSAMAQTINPPKQNEQEPTNMTYHDAPQEESNEDDLFDSLSEESQETIDENGEDFDDLRSN